MSKNTHPLDPSHKPAALKKLADHLAALGDQTEGILPAESDMLSLIVSGTLRGENIVARYPDFYRKLLGSAELRQAFLEALDSVEAERAGELLPLPGPARTNLDFLRRQHNAPVLEMFAAQKWRVTWQRTLEQINSIFKPRELIYRTDPSLMEDPWFTLLRDELQADETVFAVTLDCTLSADSDNSLSAFLSLAMTLEGTTPASFPIRASLQWGGYQASVLLSQEGRVRFPDIPIMTVLDVPGVQLQSGFSLALETVRE